MTTPHLPIVKRGRRDKRVPILFTQAEYNAIVAAANHEGSSTVSDFMRRKILAGLKVNRPFEELDLPMPDLLSTKQG